MHVVKYVTLINLVWGYGHFVNFWHLKAEPFRDKQGSFRCAL